MSKPRQEERDDALPPDPAFANEPDIGASDRILAEEGAADTRRDLADREPGTLADDDALYQEVGTRPASEADPIEPSLDDQETPDGLDALEETVREEAEDRPLGAPGDFTT